MKQDWLDWALSLSQEPADFFSGARKILQCRTLTFGPPQDDLVISDAGFTKSKMTLLRKGYVHEESLDAAVWLWDHQRKRGKYGSAGFHCYNHLVKSDPAKRSKRASVMGPCIQAVTLTHNPGRTCTVDVFYRTTEFYKKLPADLILIRDEFLPRFDFEGCPVASINFHFANITLHPMYFVTLLPHFDDHVAIFEDLRTDQRFYEWCVKWTARYICDEYHRGIAKHAQSLRVQMDAKKRLTKKQINVLGDYLRDNHPGYRGEPK